MGLQIDIFDFIEMLPQPSFCVEGGKIVALNWAARQLPISLQAPIDQLLGDAVTEYAQFTDGHLHLPLTIGGELFYAHVRKVQPYTLFCLEQDEEQIRLQTMALVSSEMRLPLADIFSAADATFPALENTVDNATLTKLAQISKGLNQLHRLAGNMSNAFESTASTPPAMTCWDVCSVLKEILERAEQLVSQCGVSLEYSIPKESTLCLINKPQLEQAVYQMLSNALKSTEAGGRIWVTLTRHDKRLHLSVQDDGCGISNEQIGNVHYRYRRIPGFEDFRPGLGLGMLLLRTAAAHHGGTVLIERPAEGGTRVTMTIAIDNDCGNTLRSDTLQIDYTGGRDTGLIALSDSLPASAFLPRKK